MNKETCIFCNCTDEILRNDYAFARYDHYPVSPGHVLIIPHRHVVNYFDTSPDEKVAMYELIDNLKVYLDETHSPDGYNVGINCGEAAGQSIFHVHIHLIPRYKGDVEVAKGGVRCVIPNKQKY